MLHQTQRWQTFHVPASSQTLHQPGKDPQYFGIACKKRWKNAECPGETISELGNERELKPASYRMEVDRIDCIYIVVISMAFKSEVL